MATLREPARSPFWVAGLSIVSMVMVASAVLLRRRRKRQRTSVEHAHYASARMWQHVDGLTEAEAEARRTTFRKDARNEQAKLARRRIWRTSTVSVFNLGVVGLAAVQWLLSDPLSAMVSLFVLALNIVMTAGQQLYGISRVERLQAEAHPLVTVIRDGRWRSVDVDDVVVDDVAVVGSGDALVAAGTLLTGGPLTVQPPDVDASSEVATIEVGDTIGAGSYCLRGRGAYRISALPPLAVDVRPSHHSDSEVLTPLQRILSRVLRALLALIALFLAVLLLDIAFHDLVPPGVETIYRDAASVLFSIAPNGLYFMIAVTYAMGSARLGSFGALIRDTRAVESLAQVTTLCLGRTGALTGTDAQLELVSGSDGETPLSETSVRLLIGDLAHTIGGDHRYLDSLKDTFGGGHRQASQVVALDAEGGWGAATFKLPDLTGTFVIGETDAIDRHLAHSHATVLEEALEEAFEEVVTERGSALRASASSALRALSMRMPSRPAHDRGESAEQAGATDQVTDVDVGDERASGVAAASGDAPTRGLRARMAALSERGHDSAVETNADATIEAIDEPESADTAPGLKLAFSAEPLPLFDRAGRRRIPSGLVSLGELSFSQSVRPEARDAVAAFRNAGVDVKVLTKQSPDTLAQTAEQLDLLGSDTDDDGLATGADLAGLTLGERRLALSGATVIGELDPLDRALAVQWLRDAGQHAAVVGEGVDDLPAMQAAHVSVTLSSASQAALGAADIVLLHDTLLALPKVLRRGQRLVNGMLDILKINLAQVGYVLLMIVAMAVGGKPVFFYHPTHGGVIALFTVLIPSLTLTIWASTGALPRQYMRTRLWHFAVPAASTMAAAALTISYIYMRAGRGLYASELAVTYGLVTMGLLLVVFVQPPSRFWVGGDVLAGEWHNTIAALVLFVVYNVLVWTPLAQDLLRLAPLTEAWDYTVIGVVVTAWALILRALWRTPRLRRAMGIVSDRIEGS